MASIKLGKTSLGYTNFYDLVCPYCGEKVKFKDCISDLDCNDTLSSDGAIVENDYKCHNCGKSMIVTLDVICNTERNKNENNSTASVRNL